MVTGRLDQPGFLALSYGSSALSRCLASSVSRKALALATAVAVVLSPPTAAPADDAGSTGAREAYTATATSDIAPSAGSSLPVPLRPVPSCDNAWTACSLMVFPL